MGALDDPRATFIEGPKENFVQQARNDAVTTAPAATPRPQTNPLVTSGTLTVEFDRTVPVPERNDREAGFRNIIYTTFGFFDVLRTFPKTKQLLDEICSFPDEGLVFPVVAPTEQPLSVPVLKRNAPATIPRVEKVWVRFMSQQWLMEDVEKSEEEQKASGRLDADGEFAPQRPASVYDIYVKFQLDREAGVKYWPCPSRADLSFSFAWRAREAQMCELIMHEMVHIWFTYKFWFFRYQHMQSFGHGDENSTPIRCSDAFFDEFNLDEVAWPPRGRPLWPGGPMVERGQAVKPFRDRLGPIYAEIDAIAKAWPGPGGKR